MVDSDILGVDKVDCDADAQGVLVAVGAGGDGEPEGEKELELVKKAGVGVISGVNEGDFDAVAQVVEDAETELDKEGDRDEVGEVNELGDTLGDAEASAVKDAAPVREDEMLLEGVVEDEIELELLEEGDAVPNEVLEYDGE